MEGVNIEDNYKSKIKSCLSTKILPSKTLLPINHLKATKRKQGFLFTKKKKSNQTNLHILRMLTYRRQQAQNTATYHTGISFLAFQTRARFDSAVHGSLQQRNNLHRWPEAVPQML